MPPRDDNDFLTTCPAHKDCESRVHEVRATDSSVDLVPGLYSLLLEGDVVAYGRLGSSAAVLPTPGGAAVGGFPIAPWGDTPLAVGADATVLHVISSVTGPTNLHITKVG